ncbi:MULTISPECIES: DEAD/DEAH box helicase [unclassified Modicisalibacter]|uniref:DEAD/DEAH box helicase n=1 Tax=unclassified Modicisalibacter TaxID=2679913 RepID=UPI001CCAE455|nr:MULTISPECIES: DEAD/DEAH box helicase [unclassified Modicisalibacter]MBZ9557475.1 DEAD/DEAH box helicase [Modicisalibacter sp. R2A 31.J]MBZ9573859.1 DEAD/DEAH box helicase [Modicisalibacter sp. MOD 31.J]
MIKELTERVWEHESFHKEMQAFRSHHFEKKFFNSSNSTFDQESLRRLLQSAAILALSENNEHREAAYKIATSASESTNNIYPGVSSLLIVVLSRIGNFPALKYALEKFALSEDQLPVQLLAESSIRKEKNLATWGKESETLTDFQKQLWEELLTGSSIGISAPTSSGKSFILQAYARKLLSERTANNIAFLVPSRALINQVSGEVSKWVKHADTSLELITTPIPASTPLPERGVYVVTQERMQLLQAAHPELKFELMLIDEMQSIADGARGVLLSSVIDDALVRNENLQLLFAGPNIQDPGNVSRTFGRTSRTVYTDEAVVGQDIIFVDCRIDSPFCADLYLLTEGNKSPLGSINSDEPLLDHQSKLTNIALTLGRGSQSLVYALGPKECEDLAFGLADTEKSKPTPYIRELSDFIKEAIHPNYQLSESVLGGVGFHYGRLPALVRKAIEDAFSHGELNYLVTTSTLLYGVNLPAKNLFLHKPQKGKDKPISSNDFWNLAGRAGRLGKEFTGNIFLIDYDDWANKPMEGNRDLEVQPSLENQIIDQTHELIDYINDPDRAPNRNNNDELENTFVKLARDHLEGRLDATLDRLGMPKNSPERSLLADSVSNSLKNSSIDRGALLASPTVSVHRQQALFERLEKSLKKYGPEGIIPKHPLHKHAYNSYVAVIKRCHGEILKIPKEDKSHTYYSMMAIRWMKGTSLPQIIDDNLKYKKKIGKNSNISTVIRETLTEIETGLRFKYVRLFSCYNAVLELVLKKYGMKELLPSIPTIPMYLEVGACSPTMISFIGLGLSRYTSEKLNRFARRTGMSQEEARNWIVHQNIDAMNLPNASIEEIKRTVAIN